DRATPVIHRDVKPSNILLNENGKALLTDFGIAKLQGESGLTRTSHLIGTPAYMSPEQCLGGDLGPASDQYSLGTVAFELLAGVPPFKGPTLVVLQSHRDMTAPDILEYRPDLPAGLAEVVRRMLAKDPEERWPTMNEAAEQFRKQIRNPVPPRILAAWSKRVHSIAISAQPDHLTLGTSEKLIAQALDHEGRALDGRRVRWSSTDERVAFVSPDGIVAGLGVGSAVIVAETGKAMTTVELKVSEPTVHHVTVSPPTLEMPAGETRQLVVTCFSRAGDTVAANPFFEVDRPDIVGVSSEGAVTGLEAGEASVTVRVAGQHETVEVRVVAAPIRTILILSSDLALALGQSARLPVETRGSDGRLQTDAALWWTSSDESVVAVSGTGVVRALGLGRATITASAGTASATLEIEVLQDEASVHTEPIGRTRPVDPGSPKGKEPSTHLGATLLFDSQEFSTEKGTVPPAPRKPSGEPPPGATVVFDGPKPDPSEGSQGWSEEQSQRAGAPGSYASAGAASKPSSHRPRQTGFSLGRKDAMAVGIGLAGAAVLFGIVSLWPSSRPEPVPVAISAAPRDTMVRVGQEFQYRLDAEGAGAGAEIDGRWRTSDASVVLVSRTGVARAVGVGSAVVSLMGEGLPPEAIQAVVTVVPLDPPGSLTILGPGEVTVGRQPWQYRLQAPSGSTLEDPETAWVVEPGSLASVSPNGQLFARAAGTVELSAALNGRTASTRVRITAPPTPTPPRTDDRPRPFDIRIAGAPTGPVEVGSTISLEARLLDEDQRTMAGDLSWASLNPGALSQTGPSSFQAVAAGVATLEVSAGLSNLSRSITVTIVPRVVEVNPTEASGVTLNPQSVE
ncbi:MAG: protein kinase, partial [Gemmatimonadetes bacterium]|nr:protein kinase [Gemmatimonadota bacterium]